MFLSVALMQIGQREDKGNAADDAHIAGHKIVEMSPVYIGTEQFFRHQYDNGTRISQKVIQSYEETYIAADLEAGNKTVEEDSLKSKIGQIKAKALGKQPGNRVQLQPLVPEGEEYHAKHTYDNQRQQDGQRLQIVPDVNHQTENNQDNNRYHRIDLRKQPR